MSFFPLISLLLLLYTPSNSFPTHAKSDPIELGKVHWMRDLNQGQRKAQFSKKPIFLLFQEVPGCATCRNYGQHVLSHPLIVEAIETLFEPVAIYNNKGGADAATLKYFNEPSWNNPVVRIVDANRKNLVKRVAGNYSQLGVVQAMIQALRATEHPVPEYLSLLQEELIGGKQGTKEAIMGMYCFWTGEKVYGQLEGVLETEAGFMGGREVVKVTYNPEVLSYGDLLKQGKGASCADHVYTDTPEEYSAATGIVGSPAISAPQSFRPDRDPKYYLSRTHFRFIPMTPTQAARANSLIGRGKSPQSILSPRQRELVAYVKAHPNKGWKNMINQSLTEGWAYTTALWKS